MQTKRLTVAAALMAAGALLFAGCQSSGSGDATASSVAPVTTVNIGQDQAPDAYNTNTATANSVYNAWVDNATQGSFWRMQPDGSIKHDEEFGTYEKTSDSPLTVKYTFNDKAVWSDGTPIDCDDALLNWAAFSGKVVGDDGKNIFAPASTAGFEKVKMPDCNAGDKSFTFEFTENYADWEVLVGGFMPAHVAAEQGGLSAANNGEELIQAIKDNDIAKLQKVADFWSTGWAYQKDLPALPDQKLIPASGYYKYDNAQNGTLTLVKNDKWWGTPAKIDRVVYKLIQAPELVQAMQNGEIDIFQPSAVDQDTVAQMDKIKDKAAYEVGTSWTYSHVDLAQYEGAVFQDIKVRQAFLKCVPREDLVNKFVTTVNPDGVVLDSHEFFPGQPEYDESLKGAPTSTAYDKVDIEGAKALLAEAGKTSPVDVRIMRAQQSDLRGQQVQLIKNSCDQAGFNIIDTPDEDWSSKLSEQGAWDAVLFAWSGSGLLLSAEPQYVTGGEQNYGGYSNAKVDELWKEITQVTSKDDATPLKIQAEEQLWADPYNVVLYANPGMQAHSLKLQGTVYNPTQYGPTWNIQDWTLDAA